VSAPHVHCGRPCPPADLGESVPLPGGKWEHLTCWLRAEKPGAANPGSPVAPAADDGADEPELPEEAP
jgi:hypothetical protein